MTFNQNQTETDFAYPPIYDDHGSKLTDDGDNKRQNDFLHGVAMFRRPKTMKTRGEVEEEATEANTTISSQ